MTFLPDPTAAEAVTETKRLPSRRRSGGREHPFYPGEEKNDPSWREGFAALGDLYVNDAFGFGSPGAREHRSGGPAPQARRLRDY